MIRCEKSIAVVILNYNGLQFLQEFLPKVIAHSSALAEVIVADNCSIDDSLSFMEANYPTVQVVKMNRNHGFAEGYNVALRQIEAKYYVLLNSDVEVTENWLLPLHDHMEGNPEVAGVQPKILSYQLRDTFEHAGASGGMLDFLGYPFCRGRIFDTVEKDAHQYEQVVSIAWASGAAMLVRADLFRAFGGLDGDFFAHMEEIDFCWRLKNAGYEWKVVPESVVYHVGGGTLNYQSPQKTYLNFRNSLWSLVKNDRSGFLLLKVLGRLLLDGLAGVLFLSQRNFASTFAIVRAHWSFFGSFPQVWSKRKLVKNLIAGNKIGDASKEGVLHSSIVWKYYVLRQKVYSSLHF